jgi:hypothetical protein
MSRAAFADLIQPLPFRLRDQLYGYALAVEEAANSILRDAGLEPTPPLRDRLVFAAGVRQLWAIVDGQYSVLDRSLRWLADYQVGGLFVGGARYTRQGEDFAEIRRLRNSLRRILMDVGMGEVIVADDPISLVPLIREEHQ